MRNILILLASLVLLASPPGRAQPQAGDEAAVPAYEDQIWAALRPTAGGLTSDQAAASARRSAPSVDVADAELSASVARTHRTLSRYVPSVSLQATFRRTNPVDYDFSGGGFSVGAQSEGGLLVGTCPDGVSQNCVVDSQGLPVGAVAPPAFEIPQNNYSIDATLSVPLSDYLLAMPPARKGAAADEAAAELRREAELRTVDVNARIAYYDWVRARAQLAISEQSLASANERLDDARRGLDAGTVTSADALGVENLVASSRVAVAQAKSFLRLAERNLLVTTQWQGPLSIGEDFSEPVATIETYGTLPELIARGQKQRHEIRALVEAARASDHASEGASAAMLPRLDGVANVTHANPNPGFFPPGPEWNTSWYVGLTMSWHLDGFLDSRAQVRELDANTRVLRAQRASLERAIELEVRDAWEEWERAEAELTISETELRAAEAMYEQRVLLFRGGEATSTDVTTAELQRANATLRKVSAIIGKRVAAARLRRAAALPLDQDARP